MTIASSAALLFLAPGMAFATKMPVPLLTQELLELSHEAAILSNLAYEDASQFAIVSEARNTNSTIYKHPDYGEIAFFTDEPDQAIFAKKDGYCFAAFRGSTLSGDDWLQNLDRNFANVTKKETKEICTARAGYVNAYYTEYHEKLEQALIDCAIECTSNDCIVLTGHSQGGAAANVASIVMSAWEPLVITFGMPAAVVAPCNIVPSNRLYRFINSIPVNGQLKYDVVPFLSKVGASFFGYMILLSYDDTGVAYLGFDENYEFDPDAWDLKIEPHGIFEEEFGYTQRLEALLNRPDQTFPIPTSGFEDGILCDTDQLCHSGRCADDTVCAEKLSSNEICQKASDCISNDCLDGACTMPETSSGMEVPIIFSLWCGTILSLLILSV